MSKEVAIKALEEALAKQEGQSNFCPNCEALSRELKAIKQEQDKPYGYVDAKGGGLFIYGEHQFQNTKNVELAPVYLHPKQRTWVGLTDDERKEVWFSCEQQTPTTFARAIEAKLKEKNT